MRHLYQAWKSIFLPYLDSYKNHQLIELLRYLCFVGRGVIKKRHIFYCIFSFINLFSFLSLEYIIDKLEATKSVTSDYQQTKGLNILIFEK
jgi:hypothetical protein